ncbi:hypothetical protein FMM05_13290 [Flavobacterium zepuense]|uniref:CD-NTase-associated protein 15 domain-containing protein n=1 Tax=Flavobacterium zepuense TaxID=2593302 RepID=A0A552UZJ0_9FLAO|nr:hypothetical protein [Flavobacterium zepuense]TRW23629.1 hypothetical protein FMM05_13290 [Flavobacterium zepuense]
MNFRYYHTSKLIILILVLVFFISPLAQWIEKEISLNKYLNTVYGYVGVFSTISILSIILLAIDKYLWKYFICKWLINIPNLNGRYEGILTSTFIDPATQLPMKKKCILEIKQSASETKIYTYYGDLGSTIQTSQAFSVSEEIVKNSNDIFEIFYIYTNNPNTLIQQLHNHLGTGHLKYYLDIKVLEGEYYNQRGLKGTLRVNFVQKKTVGRFII